MSDPLTVICGDALTELRKLPDESVHCCVTSPPYWGLRDYGIDSQLGLEATPEEYVARMVEIFHEVRRILRPDGTLWLNLGDSYAGGGNYRAVNENTLTEKQGSNRGSHGLSQRCGIVDLPPGLKPKDLCGIPWRVAFALQADGWWLRSDIIWAKPNPMPESCTDRPTKSHEYLFLLTKSASYFYDAEAIREPHQEPWRGNGEKERGDTQRDPMVNYNARSLGVREYNPAGRNKRSVWTVATAPYPEAHFATYPPDLIKPCILAGTSAKGCCASCGAPWERIIERGEPDLEHQRACGGDAFGQYSGVATKDYASAKAQDASATKTRILAGMTKDKTLGWQPTCKCDAGIVQSVVLDPFAGSGTTGAVALELGRRAVLIELNPEYCDLIRQRCNITLGFALA